MSTYDPNWYVSAYVDASKTNKPEDSEEYMTAFGESWDDLYDRNHIGDFENFGSALLSSYSNSYSSDFDWEQEVVEKICKDDFCKQNGHAGRRRGKAN